MSVPDLGRWFLVSEKPADKQRWRVSTLFANDPNEDALIQEANQSYLEQGAIVLAIALTTLGIAGSVYGPDGDDRWNVTLLAIGVIPWVLRALRFPPHPYVHAAFVYLPATISGYTEGQGWTAPAGEFDSVAAQFLHFLLIMVVVEATMATRRQFSVLAAAALVVVFTRFLLSGDLFNLAIWSAAVVGATAAAVAIRLGTLAVVRSRDALAASKAEAERRQIARDVHDVVAHTLAVTMLHLTAARMAVKRSSPDDAIEALEEAERHGRTSLTDIRRIIRVLRSDDESATDAAQPDLADVSELVERYRSAGLDLELSLHGPTDRVTPGAGLAIYRVVQEALANAARHGDGSASVDLHIGDGEVALQVHNPASRHRHAAGMGSGILGMEERVQAVGGSIEVGPQNGQWFVDARIPVADDQK